MVVVSQLGEGVVDVFGCGYVLYRCVLKLDRLQGDTCSVRVVVYLCVKRVLY